MPIELNKILADIAAENKLKPTANAKKDEIEQAWARVSKKSNLSVHETKSIFKVLQRKFESERQKDQSTWKLFEVMNEIHTPAEEEDDDESDVSMEENEEYEMLEVDEEQQQEEPQNDSEEGENSKGAESIKSKKVTLKKSSTEMTSDGESPTKSKSDTSHENSPERSVEKPTEAKKISTPSQPAPPPRDEKKLLNLLLSPNSQRLPKSITAQNAALALQKKGITVKKANPNIAQKPQQQSTPATQPAGQTLLRNTTTSEARTIQLPEALKRKLNEESALTTAPTTKKILLGQPSGNVKQISPKTLSAKSLVQGKIAANGTLLLKKENEEKISTHVREEHSPSVTTMTASSSSSANNTAAVLSTSTVTSLNHGLKVYTFPAESAAAKTEANTALKVITLPADGNGSLIANGISTQMEKSSNTNGISSAQIDELDFSDHILISTTGANNAATIKTENIPHAGTDTKEGLINLGNFSNELPRSFFNNLCNSKRYEAFALYVANAMNRLDTSIAARLEVTIMRALLDAQSEALQKS